MECATSTYCKTEVLCLTKELCNSFSSLSQSNRRVVSFAHAIIATGCTHTSDFSAEPDASSQLSFSLLGGSLTLKLQQHELSSLVPLAGLQHRLTQLTQPLQLCTYWHLRQARRVQRRLRVLLILNYTGKDSQSNSPGSVPQETTVKALTARHCLP